MITIEFGEKELREIIRKHIEEKLGPAGAVTDIKFLVKSKQNYRSTWEEAGIVVVSPGLAKEKYIPEVKVEYKVE